MAQSAPIDVDKVAKIKEAISRGIPRKDIFVTTKVFPRQFGRETTKKFIHTYLEQFSNIYLII